MGLLGPAGPPGPPGPPGESLGYDAATLAALLGQSQTKGPDRLASDEPLRILGKEINDEERRKLVLTAYEQLKTAFEQFQKPIGDKKSPGKTCRDLSVAYPELTSGEYWVDPNGGDGRDAISVYCNMQTKATCIHPKPERTPELSPKSTSDGDNWLSEIEGGVQLTYKTDRNQMTFLQLLSSSAVQNITYHCQNSVAYYDSQKRSYRNAIKLMAWNDLELTARGAKRSRYNVIEDECRWKKPEWAKTLIQYTTDKPQRLPIEDISVRDVGEQGQTIWIEVGAVCFT
jgi:collagen type II alpha